MAAIAKNRMAQLHVALYCITLSMMAAHGGGGAGGREVERQGTTGAGTWCVAREDADAAEVQAALDWACGQESGQGSVNCAAISAGGVCDTPDTLTAHASYAFNAYFQNLNQAAGTCDFDGCAQITNTDPSLGACSYPSSSTGSFLATSNVSNLTPTNGGSIPWPTLTSFVVLPSALFSLLLPFISKL